MSNSTPISIFSGSIPRGTPKPPSRWVQGDLLTLTLVIAGLAGPSQAYLKSQATQGMPSPQDVRITDHVVRATIHEGWADVEEDLALTAQISPNAWSAVPSDNQDSWEITGSFTLPEGSVLTGALLWDGSTILKAKLKGAGQASAEYESVVDRQFAPPTSHVMVDPLLIEKMGNDYSLKLFPVQWGKSRHLRIRYLVPLQSAGDGWTIPVGSAFAQEVASHPDQYEIDLVNQGGANLRLDRDGMLTPFTNTTKLVDYPITLGAYMYESSPTYHTAFSIDLPQKGTLALATSMDTGAWSGGYVVFRGKLPDTLLSKSNLRQEILVLWKWNSPNSFVENNGWSKQLSNYGSQVVDQAANLATSTTNLARASGLVRVGLLSDEGGTKPPRQFSLSKWGSDTFQLMQDYLGGVNQETILNRYSPSSTSSSGSSDAKDRKEGAKRFAGVLQTAFSLYSKDSGVVRHIVFVTAGPGADLPDPTVTLPTWPEGLTASSYEGYWYGNGNGTHWTGIDLPTLVNDHVLPANRQLTGWLPFTVPLTRVTWNLEFTAGTRSFSVDAVTGLEAGNTTMLEFNGQAKTKWNKSLTWKLFDENGNQVRSAVQDASNWIELPNDSSVARLWGGSKSHWSETSRTRLVGNLLGFVDPAHSLLATPSDSLASILQDSYRDAGVPWLLASEIYGSDQIGSETTDPVDSHIITNIVSKGVLAGFAVRTLVGGRGLTIRIPQGLDASSSLIVRDIHGRILAQWNANQLQSLRTIDWNAPSGTARGMYYVELRSGALRNIQSASVL